MGGADSSWHIVGTGDFSGDGKADILWQDTNGNVAIWEMNGFTVANSGIVGGAGSSWSIEGIGDYTATASRTSCDATPTDRSMSGR